MTCFLKPECNFLHRYFRCLLPIETMDIQVKIKMMRGIHTFRRDQTTQVISPWSTKLCLYPSLIRKMKTYLELEGMLGAQPQLQPCTSTFPPDKNSLSWKTPVPKKTEKKKRAKAPVKRRFKVRVIAQPMPSDPTLPMNPTLPADPTPTVVTTMVTSTQMPVEKTSNHNCQIQPNTYDCIQFGSRQIQESLLSHKKVPGGIRPLCPQQ